MESTALATLKALTVKAGAAGYIAGGGGGDYLENDRDHREEGVGWAAYGDGGWSGVGVGVRVGSGRGNTKV